MKYSFLKGVSKSVIQAVIFGAPIIFDILPSEWLNLTVGAVISLGLNYMKVKWAMGEPK